MTILVTGGAGYIGAHAVLALRDQGMDVVVLDDVSTGNRALLHPDAKFYQGDIADSALLKKIFSENTISAVMHFAAKLVVPESVAHPAKYYDNNVGKFTVLLRHVMDAGIPHFIFSSTAAVYGEPGIIPVTEDTPCNPINPYGASKLMAERILMDVALASGKMNFVTLRYFNVAGADPQNRAGQMTHGATHLIKVAAELATGQRNEMEIYGTDYPTADGTCVRDYIHVSDLADAHIRALDYLRSGGNSTVVNCGYGHGYSVRDVIHAVSSASGTVLNVKESPRRAGDPAALVADSRKIRELFNWQPRHDDLGEIVHTALAWEKKRLAGA